MEAHPAVAFPIQADFDTAGMKAFTPIEFFRHRKVMPLEAQPGATHAAMQMAPAVPDRMPDRTFGERRQLVSLVVDFDWSHGKPRHADNLPIRNPGARGKTGVRSSGVQNSEEQGFRSRESGVRSCRSCRSCRTRSTSDGSLGIEWLRADAFPPNRMFPTFWLLAPELLNPERNFPLIIRNLTKADFFAVR